MPCYPLVQPLREWLDRDDGKQPPSGSPTSQLCHPGLLLDRYAGFPYKIPSSNGRSSQPDEKPQFAEFSQENGQKPHIEAVIRANEKMQQRGGAILTRWCQLAHALPGACCWTQKTIWRLTAHLSRASVLENGACCLHPLYGFAYLPGSGLKGLARAYAELHGEANTDDFRRIFGDHERADIGAGDVVFIEAWPEQWPKLEIDIVNSHHPDYYRNEGKGHPPGDWEDPNPTYFLAVAPGTTFRFCVAPRSLATTPDDVTKAARWLQAALAELGAGAKTAAGYGYFEPVGEAASRSGTASGASEEAAKQRAQQARDRHLETIEALGGPSDVSRMDSLVAAIERECDPDGRRECAQRICQWLRKHKLWNKEKHRDKPWHQKVAEWLGESDTRS